jgi:flagellar motor switch/type III secretory pathway protein FliN
METDAKIKRYPLGQLPQVSREALAWQPARQRTRAILSFLNQSLCESASIAQPKLGWHTAGATARGPLRPKDKTLTAPSEGGGVHIQMLATCEDGLLMLVIFDPGLAAALTATDLDPLPRLSLASADTPLSTLARAHLDALLLDALARVAGALPPGCGWRLMQSGLALEPQLRVFRSREALIETRLPMRHTPLGGQPREDNLWIISPARLDTTHTAQAIWSQTARLTSWWPLLLNSPQHLIALAGWGTLDLHTLQRAARGDVLVPSQAPTRLPHHDTRPDITHHPQTAASAALESAAEVWHFAPCWVGWEGRWLPCALSISTHRATLRVLPPRSPLRSDQQGPPHMTPDHPAITSPRIHTDPTPQAAATDAVIERMPVQARFEIGRVVMSAHDVAHLQSGDVIELRQDLRAHVKIWVGDILAGEGELVDVDGLLGVRVLWIAPRNPPADP